MIKTISLIGFIQAIFGILIFATEKPKHISFKIIVFWLAIISVSLGTKLLPFDTFDSFNIGVFPILFLHGPLLYYYVSSLTNENFKLKWSVSLHAIPFFVIEIYRFLGNAVSVNSSSDLTENPNYIYNNIYFSLLIISLITYWVLSLNLILRHRKSIPYNFSNYTGRNTLNWLMFLMSLFLIFFISDIFISNIEKLTNTIFVKISSLHVNLTIFVFILIFFGIKQSVIYKKQETAFENSENDFDSNTADLNNLISNVNQKQIDQLTETVIHYLENKKPYLNSEYSLQMMADDLDIPKHKITYIINSGRKKNFHKLINEYRVEEVKRMLKDPAYKNYTVLGVAYECGFNSKSTFNRIFKEETGYTPSNYKRSS